MRHKHTKAAYISVPEAIVRQPSARYVRCFPHLCQDVRNDTAKVTDASASLGHQHVHTYMQCCQERLNDILVFFEKLFCAKSLLIVIWEKSMVLFLTRFLGNFQKGKFHYT